MLFYKKSHHVRLYEWPNDATDSFDLKILNSKCKDLNKRILQKNLSIGRIYNELSRINSLCITSTRKPNRKIILSSETRKFRKFYKRNVSRWKEFPTNENLNRLMENRKSSQII